METTAVLVKRAASGDAAAQFRLGYRFAFCRDAGRRDWSQAFAFWRAAARQGHARAEFFLATCYDFGRGVRKNLRQAMQCYRRAAEAGHVVAA